MDQLRLLHTQHLQCVSLYGLRIDRITIAQPGQAGENNAIARPYAITNKVIFIIAFFDLNWPARDFVAIVHYEYQDLILKFKSGFLRYCEHIIMSRWYPYLTRGTRAKHTRSI